MSNDHLQLIKDHILDQENFRRAIFKGQQRNEQVPWLKVTLRPVLLKGERHLQFAYFETRKSVTKNYAGAELQEKLAELLGLPFKSYYVEGHQETVQVQISKKGKALIHRSQTATVAAEPELAHDRTKDRLLPADKPDAFLKAVGIMTEGGQIKADMQSKYRQINEFLKLVDKTLDIQPGEHPPLHLVDFGCGNAYLTFAAYHYLNNLLGIPTHLTGVDVQDHLLQRHLAKSQALGWSNISFEPTRIIDFKPETPVDVVFALHACDTASDEALAQGIKLGSQFIFAVPCCHHHLQQQLHQQTGPSAFRPVLRHGILKEELGTILTEAFRANILRIMGYKTDVVQFIAAEHTPKNLMIRAVKSTPLGDPEFIQAYNELKAYWQVTPYLEELLGEGFTHLIRIAG
jgi:hypothetical protein